MSGFIFIKGIVFTGNDPADMILNVNNIIAALPEGDVRISMTMMGSARSHTLEFTDEAVRDLYWNLIVSSTNPLRVD